MSMTLGQARARHWARCIAAAGLTNEEWKQAQDFAKSFPMEIRLHGLGLAVAMRSSDKERGVRFMLDALANWLLEPAPDHPPATASALLVKLIERSSLEYFVAVDKAMAWLAWGRPMIDAKSMAESDREAAAKPEASNA